MRLRVECWRGDPPHLRMLQGVATRLCRGERVSLQGATIEQTLRRLSSDRARRCYADLCEIDAALREHRPPVLEDLRLVRYDWSDSAAVRRFHRAVVDRGLFVDRLMDCISEPDVTRRQALWRTARKDHNAAVAAQRQLAAAQSRWCHFLASSREANAAAYDALRHITETDEAWSIVLRLEVAELARLPPPFWATVSLNGRTLEERRALAHKIEKCRALSPQCTRMLEDLRCAVLTEERSASV